MTKDNAEKAANLLNLIELYEKKVPEKLRDLYKTEKYDEIFNMAHELSQKLAQLHNAQLAAL